MISENQLPNHLAINITARLLFMSLFVISGITHFTDVPYYVSLMPEGFPHAVFWVWVSGAVELAAAGMIIANWRPRLGAWLLVAFMIPVTFVVHGYQMVTADTEVIRAMQQAHFIKGISLTGAALLITQLGVTGNNGRPSDAVGAT